MRNRLAFQVSLLAAIFIFPSQVFAQTSGQSLARSPAAEKTQRSSAPRDLSGVWNVQSGIYQYAAFSKDEPPMTEWGLARFREAKPSQGNAGVKLEETNDRVYKCSPPGLPYIYIQLFPVQIVQTASEVIEYFEYDHTVRFIYTDGRKHPADLQPSYNGHSIGHWEGDTLVVDTVGLNGKNWLDRVGHPESAEMHIMERIRRVDDMNLQIEFTFADSKSYTKPWTSLVLFRRHPEWDILEHVCEDNLAFESFEK
jgi:hypothetical protein